MAKRKSYTPEVSEQKPEQAVQPCTILTYHAGRISKPCKFAIVDLYEVELPDGKIATYGQAVVELDGEYVVVTQDQIASTIHTR